jgi:hypothetical protein
MGEGERKFEKEGERERYREKIWRGREKREKLLLKACGKTEVCRCFQTEKLEREEEIEREREGRGREREKKGEEEREILLIKSHGISK